ncbi:MAG TPA: HAD family hydrolase [Polyangiaceae bacterium]|nr:HAD family hydrolase [Polyangiaceae bacterium]
MRRTLLLWDIDGTLLLTDGAGMRGMARAGRKLYGDAFRWDGVTASGRLDPLILEDALTRNRLTASDDGHRIFHDAYLAELALELELVRERARAMPGVHDLIAALRERSARQNDVVQGLVTGNYARAAPLKLRACGFDPAWFEIGAFGDEGRTRPDLVALALRRCHERLGWAPDPEDVLVIGDTPLDIECAHAHGCVAFAVATGRHGVDELRAAGADVVVRDLSDPRPLLDWINRHSPAF